LQNQSVDIRLRCLRPANGSDKSTQVSGSLLGLGVVCAGLCIDMAIFLYHGFVKGVPRELDESASMDGCGEWKAFFLIIFPLLAPITFTIVVLSSLHGPDFRQIGQRV
jgi:ABC-type glycerol-3-phosphate transport system permease component